MGSALAANLVGAGHEVVTHDVAGPGRTPTAPRSCPASPRSPAGADVVVLSLPDGPVSEAVAGEIAGTAGRRATHVVDTSTIGVAAARAIDALLADAGVAYVDAPVSGGVAGARARTLAVMYAGTGRRVRGRRARARRPERPPAPGRRPAGDGAGAEARQQLPVGDGAGRHQRGDRLRPVGRARHGHDARGPRRLERPQRGHERQVPEPRPDRPLRRRGSPTR